MVSVKDVMKALYAAWELSVLQVEKNKLAPFKKKSYLQFLQGCNRNAIIIRQYIRV